MIQYLQHSICYIRHVPFVHDIILKIILPMLVSTVLLKLTDVALSQHNPSSMMSVFLPVRACVRGQPVGVMMCDVVAPVL
jgi:hypothetical protein